MKNTFLIFFLVLFSCKNNGGNKFNVSGTQQRDKNVPLKESITNCLPADTIDDKISIKYINMDSFFTVHIAINTFDSVLPYKFDCSTSPVLIPSVYSIGKNIICLKRGYGQEYKEFIISYVEDKRLVIKKYEIALAIDLRTNSVVYQDYKNLDNIYVENIKTGNKKEITIPSNILSRHISETLIEGNRVTLKFASDETFKYSLH